MTQAELDALMGGDIDMMEESHVSLPVASLGSLLERWHELEVPLLQLSQLLHTHVRLFALLEEKFPHLSTFAHHHTLAQEGLAHAQSLHELLHREEQSLHALLHQEHYQHTQYRHLVYMLHTLLDQHAQGEDLTPIAALMGGNDPI